MKKILLINTNTEKIPYPVPPVGICLLAEVLKNDYEVKIFDGMFDESESEDALKLIDEFKPDYIGLSLRNIDNLHVVNNIFFIEEIDKKYVKPIKKIAKVPIILGGSAFSINPEYFMERFEADYGVIGEGEIAFKELLKNLDEGKTDIDIPQVIVKGKKPVITYTNQYNLINLPFSEIDKKIDFTPYKERGVYSIQTKRGCYHECIYCTYPNIEGKKYRVRSPKSIADEIEEAHYRLGDVTFEFVDSTFNDPPGHAEAICKEIIKKKIDVRLRTMGINPVNVTHELFDLMKKAGFAQIDCTPDTASPQLLSKMKKNFTYKQLEMAAKTIKDFGMPTVWFLIFGGPGETEETIKESFDFIDKWVYDFDVVHMTIGMRIFPNTPLQQIAINEGIILPDDKLAEPTFYVNKNLDFKKIDSILREYGKTRPNCLIAYESAPSENMIKIANRIRKRNNLSEPMFRTLLRIRYSQFQAQILK